MAYCGEHTAVKGNAEQATVVSLRCRSWTCEHCQDTRKAQLIAQAIGGQPTTFLTLTTRRKPNMTPEQAAKRLSWAWRVIRLRLMRMPQYKALPFIAVMEKHVSGWPHLHLLLRSKWLPHSLISQWMAELCDGPVVWIEKIERARKAAVYCSKYCGKCAEKIGNAKRYWQSRDYDQREKPEEMKKPLPGHGWEMWPKDIYHMAKTFETWGFEVKFVRGHMFKAQLAQGGQSP